VKDGATAIAALGQDIDTAMVDLKGGTTGQVLAKASGTDLDFSWVAPAAATVFPAFSAFAASNQTITSATWTKVTFGSETFDTNTNFASSRFTPTVAGYYQVNTTIGMSAGSASDTYMAFYKNGSVYQVLAATATLTFSQFNGASLIYCNGSTDYIEVYVNKTGSGTVTIFGGANGADSWFNGVGVKG
jgi:hypothetical protein